MKSQGPLSSSIPSFTWRLKRKTSYIGCFDPSPFKTATITDLCSYVRVSSHRNLCGPVENQVHPCCFHRDVSLFCSHRIWGRCSHRVDHKVVPCKLSVFEWLCIWRLQVCDSGLYSSERYLQLYHSAVIIIRETVKAESGFSSFTRWSWVGLLRPPALRKTHRPCRCSAICPTLNFAPVLLPSFSTQLKRDSDIYRVYIFFYLWTDVSAELSRKL